MAKKLTMMLAAAVAVAFGARAATKRSAATCGHTASTAMLLRF